MHLAPSTHQKLEYTFSEQYGTNCTRGSSYAFLNRTCQRLNEVPKSITERTRPLTISVVFLSEEVNYDTRLCHEHQQVGGRVHDYNTS